VLTKRRLDETVPIGNAAMEERTFLEWDKDDIDALKLMKVDILALGMLSALRKSFELLPRCPTGGRSATSPTCRRTTRRLRDALPGRLRGRLPGGEPRADVDAAPAEAAAVLRPGHRGGDRPARARSRATWSTPT
jgi:hypothetical protein